MFARVPSGAFPPYCLSLLPFPKNARLTKKPYNHNNRSVPQQDNLRVRHLDIRSSVMIKIFVLTFSLITLGIDNAHAYIDFGTGSYVLQILAASAIGFIFVLRNYLQRIKQFFVRKKPSDDDKTDNANGTES
jgi:hypothetical protein